MKSFTISPELKADLLLRHQRMQAIMKDGSIDGCILTGNANLCYAIGAVANAYFYLPVEGHSFLFVHKSTRIQGEHIYPYHHLEDIPAILAEHLPELPLTIAIEEDEISAREYHRLCQLFQPAQPVPNANVARLAREIKTPYECNIIRRDGKRLADAYKRFPALFEPGMSDTRFTAAIEHELRKEGHQGLFRTFGFRMEAHMGTVLAGDNASVPSPYDFSLGGLGTTPLLPLGAMDTIIHKGESIMVDISGNFSGFMLDLSRTFSYGTLSERAYTLHNASIEIIETLTSIAKPGIPCNHLYDKALEIVQKYDATDCFMGMDKKAKFIGHGIGYEINELPIISARYARPLEENMVIALEPKFIVSGIGAVGVEDTFIVEHDGLSCVTDGCTRDISLVGQNV